MPLRKRRRRLQAGRIWLILMAALLTAVVLLQAALFVERQNREAHRVQEENQVREAMLLLQSRLEGNLRSSILLAQGLVSVIAANPSIDQAGFARAARPLFEGQSQLRNIGGAPDLVIRLMYPLAGNEQALGLDYRKTPAQRAAAERARDTGELVLAGPLELRQGGSGLVGRIPVFVGDGPQRRFWGLLSVVIDVERLYRDSGLRNPDLAIEVGLRGRDATGEQGAVFFGDPALFEADVLRLPVDLPHGSWQMAARPAGGWTPLPANAVTVRIVFAATGALLVGLLLLLAFFDWRQMRAEAQLAASEARLSLAVDAARLAIWDWNIETNQLVGNQALDEILGPRRGTAAPAFDDLEARLHPDDRARTRATVLAHLGDPQAGLEAEFRLRGAGGWHWFRGLGQVVARDAAGRPRRITGVLQDITDFKRMLDDLVEARSAAEAGSRAKSEFLATMSHEIRTPMNGVLGMADLLTMTPLDAEQRGYVATLQNSGRALLNIINDILDFSKIEAGRLKLEIIDFDLAQQLDEVCELLRPQAKAKGVRLEPGCPADLPAPLRGDAYRIRQVLLNLIGNAVKFTPAGRVDVELGWRPAGQGARVRVSVRDSGIGIPPELQPQLFSPFAQGDASTTRRFGGTGLGLAISQRLVEAMGGEIGFASTPGSGTCFWFELDLPRGRAPRRELAEPAAPAGHYSGRVLVVEDNPVNMQVACLMLGRLGLETVSAENGRVALERFAGGGFDLVLMDMQMPEMDGIEATLALRAFETAEGLRATPIVALTANVQQEDRQRCLEAGMNDFVAKPFRPEDLVALLNRWLLQAEGDVAAPALAADVPAAAGEPQQILEVAALDELTAATGMARGEIVALIAGDIWRLAGEIEAAGTQAAPAELRRLAHTVKSVAAQLGAKKLSALARSMEFAARDGEIAAYAAQLPEFRAAVAELRMAVDALA